MMEKASASLDLAHALYAPGLKRRARKAGEACYWIPPEKDVKAGYAPRTLTLAADLDEYALAARCRELWADLERWRAGAPAKPTRYTISWLIDRYMADPLSPYHALRASTLRDYDFCLRVIRTSVGNRLIDHVLEGGMFRPRITGEDFRRWHHQWGKPGADGIATRPGRARHMVEKLRVLLSYALEIGVPGAKSLRDVLGAIRFPVTPPRQSAPTRAQVLALVAKALEMNLRSIAITTLAQFEFTERRTHIIGAWEKGRWCRGWTWANISNDGVIAYQQTKKRQPVERRYDLRDTPALLELLRQTPEDSRIGPVVICEATGRPWRERHYIAAFSKVREKAGLPDDIWSMDMRAGGATEAGNIQGVTPLDIQAAGGWSDPGMAARYTRDRQGRAQNVVRLRQAAK